MNKQAGRQTKKKMDRQHKNYPCGWGKKYAEQEGYNGPGVTHQRHLDCMV